MHLQVNPGAGNIPVIKTMPVEHSLQVISRIHQVIIKLPVFPAVAMEMRLSACNPKGKPYRVTNLMQWIIWFAPTTKGKLLNLVSVMPWHPALMPTHTSKAILSTLDTLRCSQPHPPLSANSPFYFLQYRFKDRQKFYPSPPIRYWKS